MVAEGPLLTDGAYIIGGVAKWEDREDCEDREDFEIVARSRSDHPLIIYIKDKRRRSLARVGCRGMLFYF